MALQKQVLNINFAQGLDTKTDPWQVQPGKMLELENAVFEKQGQLKKRNGFKKLLSLPDSDCKTVTTFKGDLVAFGKSFYGLTNDQTNWVNYGSLSSVKVAVNPVVRRSRSQLGQNTAVNKSGLACTVWKDDDNYCYYQIYDADTGQISFTSYALGVSGITNINVIATTSSFVVFYVTGTGLYARKVGFTAPFTLSSATTITTSLASSSAPYAITLSPTSAGSIVVAYVAATSIKYLQLNLALQVQIAEQTLAVTNTTFISLSSYVNELKTISYVAVAIGRTALDNNTVGFVLLDGVLLSQLIAPTLIVGETVTNVIVQISDDSNALLFVTNIKKFWYTNTTATDTYQPVIAKIAIEWDSDFSVTTTNLGIFPSIAIASQPFRYNNTTYFLAAYDFYNVSNASVSQEPTYFLVDGNFKVISKIASTNSAFDITRKSLTLSTVIGTKVYIGYRLKTLLLAYNNEAGDSTNTQPGFYSQAGLNCAIFDFSSVSMDTAEIGANLNINGGVVKAFDGASLTEQNFNVFPERCVARENAFNWTVATVSGIAHLTLSGEVGLPPYEVNDIIQVSAAAGAGNTLPNGISASTNYYVKTIYSENPFVFSISATLGGAAITVSNNGSGTLNIWEVGGVKKTSVSGSGDIRYWYQAIYEWTDAQGNIHKSSPSPSFPPGGLTVTHDLTAIDVYVPKIYLTDRTGLNQITVVIYRYSNDEPVFHQVSSTTIPILNATYDTTDRHIDYSDYLADSSILGNPVIYTTGNVLPNVAPPPSSAISLFKNRLWVVDSEDKNLLWYSKPVLEGVPVEFALSQTLYVSPSLVVNDSSSPITALAAMDDKLVIFKKESIYYLTGIGPDVTGANNDFNDPIFITSTIGCINTKSIVLSPNGLMFESDKGRWLLGRDLSTQYIGAPVEAYNQTVTLSSITVPGTNQVRFTLDNNLTLMYDYFYNQWGTFRGIGNIGSTVYQSLHTFIDSKGNVYQESPNLYYDGTTPVVMKFKTSWFNIAGLQGLERVYYAHLIANYISPHKLLIDLSYDYNPSSEQTVTISPNNYSAAYGSDVLYGTGSPYGGPYSLEQWRVFFNRQKCQSFQLTVQEQFDPSFGTAPGAGLTMSGINLTIGSKLGHPKLPASQSRS